MDDIGSTFTTAVDTKGNIKSAAASLSYFTYENNMIQHSTIKHDKGNFLDLCFFTDKGVIVNKPIDFLFNGNNEWS